ncbi:MAG: thrombospondin type 3 repeat-containing protein [Kiritimatiellae bacterium]|nr:thrombospondin type 3 repeat-containing protein [Kiritimatiellia bacterium]
MKHNLYLWCIGLPILLVSSLALIGAGGSNSPVTTPDTDGDKMPDWWKTKYFGNLAQGPNDDLDYDKLINLQEYLHGTDPTKPDTDGDGLFDGWEVAHGKNPLNPKDAEPEVTNMRERARHRIVQRWRLFIGKSPVFTNTPGSPADLKDMQDALNALSGKSYKKE